MIDPKTIIVGIGTIDILKVEAYTYIGIPNLYTYPYLPFAQFKNKRIVNVPIMDFSPSTYISPNQ